MRKTPILLTVILLGLFCSCSLKKDKRIDQNKINEHYSSVGLSVNPQNVYEDDYNLLIKELQQINRPDVIAKTKRGFPFVMSCEILGDYFTSPKLKGKYAKTEVELYPVQAAIIKATYDKKLYDLNDIEKIEKFNYKDLTVLFQLMRKLDVKWILRENNYIEFSGCVPPADNGLDFYNGYIYCVNDSVPEINKNVSYPVLYRLDDNWYFFVRETDRSGGAQ
ncbi:MAG: hypothetical protein ACK5M7_08280 [Draconibacterium sp.]